MIRECTVPCKSYYVRKGPALFYLPCFDISGSKCGEVHSILLALILPESLNVLLVKEYKTDNLVN
jgi:hypothetical protein